MIPSRENPACRNGYLYLHEESVRVSELDILIWIRDSMSCGVLDIASETADVLASTAATYCLALLLLIPRKTRGLGFLILVSEAVCDILFEISLKEIVGRARPFEEYPAELIISAPQSSSFPSGHTANAFVFAFPVLAHYRKAGIALMVCAAFVAFSRLYLFVHWPTDVTAGAVFALVCTAAVCALLERYVFPKEKWQRFAGYGI